MAASLFLRRANMIPEQWTHSKVKNIYYKHIYPKDRLTAKLDAACRNIRQAEIERSAKDMGVSPFSISGVLGTQRKHHAKAWKRVDSMVALRKKGVSIKEIAKTFDLSMSRTRDILDTNKAFPRAQRNEALSLKAHEVALRIARATGINKAEVLNKLGTGEYALGKSWRAGRLVPRNSTPINNNEATKLSKEITWQEINDVYRQAQNGHSTERIARKTGLTKERVRELIRLRDFFPPSLQNYNLDIQGYETAKELLLCSDFSNAKKNLRMFLRELESGKYDIAKSYKAKRFVPIDSVETPKNSSLNGIAEMTAELNKLRRKTENLKRLNALYLQQLSRTSIRRWGLAK
jgi:lambda repressor-like predicted transcriptional regulator